MCIFCDLANGRIKTYKIYDDDKCCAFLDISQATYGHCLVVPKEHFDDIFSLDEEVGAHLFKVAVSLAKKLKEKLNFEGINILNNNGEVAGQTVKHYHIHLIPRYKADDVLIEFKSNKLSDKDFEDLVEKLK